MKKEKSMIVYAGKRLPREIIDWNIDIDWPLLHSLLLYIQLSRITYDILMCKRILYKLEQYEKNN